jgi:hypothetical protein
MPARAQSESTASCTVDEGGKGRHGAATRRTQSPVQQAARQRALEAEMTWGEAEHGTREGKLEVM